MPLRCSTDERRSLCCISFPGYLFKIVLLLCMRPCDLHLASPLDNKLPQHHFGIGVQLSFLRQVDEVHHTHIE